MIELQQPDERHFELWQSKTGNALARLRGRGRPQMSNPRNIALVLAAALLLVPFFTGTASADACIVADPTGTPLNVRKRPSQHAPIIGALNNGITVSTRMSRGDWVHIVLHEAPGKSGWAWRKFIDCPESTQSKLPELPEDIEIAWRCD